MGESSPWGSNWVDNYAGVDVFMQNGKRYLYVEDVYLGKSDLYRIDNLDSILRSHFTFTWPGASRWGSDDRAVPINVAPSLDRIADLTISEGSASKEVLLTAIAPDPAAGTTQNLSITATSSDRDLIGDPAVIYDGHSQTASLRLDPASTVR